MEFNKNMNVFEIIKKDIRTLDILEKHKMHCMVCNGAHTDTLEMACKANEVSLDIILYDLNKLKGD